MPQFSQKYFGPFDQRYYPYQIGTTVAPSTDASLGVDAQLRTGAKTIEISVGGASSPVVGRTQGGPLPTGAYGREQRGDIRQMGDINRARLSVHADSNAQLAPLNEKGFDSYLFKRTMDELRANIDFAGDIGAKHLVVHVIGNIRPPTTAAGKELFEDKGLDIYQLVDLRSGDAFGTLRGDSKVMLPKLREVNGTWGYERDENGEVQYLTSKDVGVNTDYYTFRDAVDYFDRTLSDSEKEMGLDGLNKAVRHFIKHNEMLQRSEYLRYKEIASDSNKQYNDLKKAIDVYEDLGKWKDLKDEDKLHLRRWAEHRVNRYDGLDDAKKQLTSLKNQHDAFSGHAGYYYSQLEQQGNLLKPYKDPVLGKEFPSPIQPSSVFAARKSSEALAELALYSYKKNRDDPVVIGAENLFPRFYGSHPDEIRDLIKSSREVFTDKLVGEGVNRDEAGRTAERVIGMTFDIAHANMWRRYWKGDRKSFEDWLVKQSENIAKEGIIKEIHVNDNFGYEDDSLAPGEAETPNKEVLDRIREDLGDVPMISEGYAQPRGQSWRQLTGAWEHFNPSLYSQRHVIPGAPELNWERTKYLDAHARVYSPNFLVGPTAPSEDWTTWSELPLE